MNNQIEEAINHTSMLSKKEIEDWIGKVEDEKYVDPRISVLKKVIAQIQIWGELSTQSIKLRERYLLLKRWGDEKQAQQCLIDATPIISHLVGLEEELRENLPKIRGINFLNNSELALLPIWMVELIK